MIKKLLYVGLLVLATIVVLVLFLCPTSAQDVVANTIEQVKAGHTAELELPTEHLDKIRSIYQFAETNQLSVPKVSLQETARTEEQVQVVAFYEMLEYGENNQVKKAHTESLIFTLQKIGWRSWKIAEVEKQ
ncbi:hypothetical protein EV586_107112 [Tumebacillus sp. BK434]|uniref:hypothetical protein n=1 Tax=Tumebacillus sp. BK434 TaxID=2512169 RepID=UPI0010CF0653|nr:hypothetical protein [Tumebacillus sp. BK434]TCP52869.1 hypothetical protein EV586_107112 [Tumebacillus sp. BK434]